MFLNTTSKSLLSSLLIHSLIIGGYFFYLYEKPLKIASKEKTISIDLKTYQLPKQNINKQKPLEKPKTNKIKKVKEKTKPKIKPIKKIEQKNKPIIQKKIKSIIKPELIQRKEVIKPIKTKQFKNKQTQQQAFIKTNFAIIRDMVLANLEYPMIAKKMGWQGFVKMRLIIDVNGKLIYYDILQSSNKKQLDKAAIKAVESISKELLPKPKNKTTLILPIAFNLN